MSIKSIISFVVDLEKYSTYNQWQDIYLYRMNMLFNLTQLFEKNLSTISLIVAVSFDSIVGSKFKTT